MFLCWSAVEELDSCPVATVSNEGSFYSQKLGQNLVGLYGATGMKSCVFIYWFIIHLENFPADRTGYVNSSINILLLSLLSVAVF